MKCWFLSPEPLQADFPGRDNVTEKERRHLDPACPGRSPLRNQETWLNRQFLRWQGDEGTVWSICLNLCALKMEVWGRVALKKKQLGYWGKKGGDVAGVDWGNSGLEAAYYRTSEGEEAMRGRHPRTKININDRVSGAKARVHQEKKKQKRSPIYKGTQQPWEGKSMEDAYSSTEGGRGEQQTLGQQSSGTMICTVSGFCGSTAVWNSNKHTFTFFFSLFPTKVVLPGTECPVKQ